MLIDDHKVVGKGCDTIKRQVCGRGRPMDEDPSTLS
jgi:hypothetical protein